MKKPFVIVLIILLVVILLVTTVLLCLKLIKDNKKIENIKRFSFSYTTGYAMYSNVRYTLTNNDKIIITIKPDGVSEEEALELEVDSSFLSELEKILNDNKVSSWDGFNKSDKFVLDGDSFSLSLDSDSVEVSSHGYMMWPRNYSNVKMKLDELFMNKYNK